jgi:hypothetical protein
MIYEITPSSTFTTLHSGGEFAAVLVLETDLGYGLYKLTDAVKVLGQGSGTVWNALQPRYPNDSKGRANGPQFIAGHHLHVQLNKPSM